MSGRFSSTIASSSSSWATPRSSSAIRRSAAIASRRPCPCREVVMRWGLRYQLLVPPLLLLLAVAGITTWTALAAAQRARRQLDDRVRQIARALAETEFPRTEKIYRLL